MSFAPETITRIIDYIHVWYPGWTGVEDPRFQENEIIYKRNAMAKAQVLIEPVELGRLLEQGAYDEFVARLKKAGQLTNLLYLSRPSSGDLSILHYDTLDRPSFCRAMYDLLYGAGDSEQRFQRYIDYVTTNQLPNKWTFPTYFLYFTHPDSEIFVKPSVTHSFLQLVDVPVAWVNTLSGESYRAIRQVGQDVLGVFRSYGAVDMVDAQSIIWTAGAVHLERLEKSGPGSKFKELFVEFLGSYPNTEAGRQHLAFYAASRQAAADNFAVISAVADRGDNVTDQVLLKLLPYADNTRNRNAGAWIHVAPTINGDLKKWFENARWTRPEDWPNVARGFSLS